MTRILEKTSELDRLEAKLLKRPSYHRVHAQTQSISKIAAKVIRFRASKGLSQAAMAKTAGISRKLLNEIEGLNNDNPSLKTLEALAAAMHMPVNKLLA
jgi:DNA-binding XRE family transcriptional regulator